MYAKSRLTCALMPKIGSSATEGCCRSAVANAICHAVGVPVVECIEGPLGETCVVEQSNLVVHASGHFEISEGKRCGGGTGTRGQRCHISATTVARQLASQRCQARRCHPRPQSPQTYVTGVSPNGGTPSNRAYVSRSRSTMPRYSLTVGGRACIGARQSAEQNPALCSTTQLLNWFRLGGRFGLLDPCVLRRFRIQRSDPLRGF